MMLGGVLHPGTSFSRLSTCQVAYYTLVRRCRIFRRARWCTTPWYIVFVFVDVPGGVLHHGTSLSHFSSCLVLHNTLVRQFRLFRRTRVLCTTWSSISCFSTCLVLHNTLVCQSRPFLTFWVVKHTHERQSRIFSEVDSFRHLAVLKNDVARCLRLCSAD